MKRLAFIARNDNTGLGIESREILEHLKPDRVLFVERHRPPDDNEIKDLLAGADILLCLETPYNWNAFNIARQRKIKSILRINYEWLADPLPSYPDLFISPVQNYYWNKIPEPKIFLPFPVDTNKIKFKKRRRAKVFLHIAGRHNMFADRNGTQTLLEAIKLVKADAKFIIYSQDPMPPAEDKRIELRIGDFPNYWELYKEGDIMILPRHYAGQSLPLNEALAAGMPVIMTDMLPQNKILPQELLIPIKEFSKIKLAREVEYGIFEISALAKKIEEFYNKDIGELSEWANDYAQKISWNNLIKKYKEIIYE